VCPVVGPSSAKRPSVTVCVVGSEIFELDVLGDCGFFRGSSLFFRSCWFWPAIHKVPGSTAGASCKPSFVTSVGWRRGADEACCLRDSARVDLEKFKHFIMEDWGSLG